MIKPGRRFFFKAALAALFSFNFFPASSFTKPRTRKNRKFMHVVFFWLKDPENDRDRQKFEKELKTLTENIKVIKSAHLGKPAETNRSVIDSSYSYSLILGFENKADQDIYQEHPVHLKFIKNASDLWERVVVYDSESM